MEQRRATADTDAADVTQSDLPGAAPGAKCEVYLLWSSDDKDEVERRLAAADADAAANRPEMFPARFLRASYVRFGRSLPTGDGELADQAADDKTRSVEQQKRSPHMLFVTTFAS